MDELLSREIASEAETGPAPSVIATHETSTAERLLNYRPHPCALVDNRGRILSASTSARRLFERADGVLAADDRLIIQNRSVARQLKAALGDMQPEATTQALLVPRSHNPMPLAIRFHERNTYSAVQSAGLVEPVEELPTGLVTRLAFIDLGARVQIRRDILAQVFSLTPRELDVAEELVDGRSPAEASCRLNITYETVRSHIKQLLQKTGVSRQTQLVRLLLIAST